MKPSTIASTLILGTFFWIAVWYLTSCSSLPPPQSVLVKISVMEASRNMNAHDREKFAVLLTGAAYQLHRLAEQKTITAEQVAAEIRRADVLHMTGDMQRWAAEAAMLIDTQWRGATVNADKVLTLASQLESASEYLR